MTRRRYKQPRTTFPDTSSHALARPQTCIQIINCPVKSLSTLVLTVAFILCLTFPLTALFAQHVTGSTPGQPQVSSFGDGYVSLWWQTCGVGQFRYSVFRATSEGGPYAKVETSDFPRYQDRKVAKGQSYWYEVSCT